MDKAILDNSVQPEEKETAATELSMAFAKLGWRETHNVLALLQFLETVYSCFCVSSKRWSALWADVISASQELNERLSAQCTEIEYDEMWEGYASEESKERLGPLLEGALADLHEGLAKSIESYMDPQGIVLFSELVAQLNEGLGIEEVVRWVLESKGDLLRQGPPRG